MLSICTAIRRYEEQLLEIIVMYVSQVQLSQRDFPQKGDKGFTIMLYNGFVYRVGSARPLEEERKANHEVCIGM